MNKMMIVRILIGLCTLVVVIAWNVYKLLQGKQLGFSDLISIPIVLMVFFNSITWDSLKQESDELSKLITYKSAKISYFALMALIFIVFLIEEFPAAGNHPVQNIPLFIVLCASTIVLPFVEFIVSRKYR